MNLPPLAPCVPLFAAGDELPLRSLVVQLVVIILAARLGAAVARRFRQPSVVGEIVAGLLLGPSAFGTLFPEAFAAVFRPAADGSAAGVLEASLTSFSQVGLILLLFLVGIEFDFSHIRRQGRLAAAVSAAGVAVPFTLGAALAWAMAPRLGALGAAGPIDPRSFALFLGTAMSITAIPILGRMLIEMGLQHTRLGTLVIAAAACDDAVGWTLLATVSAIARGSFEPATVLRMVAATLSFAAFALFVFRPLVLPRLERAVDASGRLPTAALSLVLAAVFVAAWVTSQIGIFAIFGAFVLGAALSGSPRLREAVAAHFTDFVTVFFLPIFFTFTGLRTDVGSLAGPEAWGWCAAVFAVAVIGKWGGCGLAARLGGMPAGEAACVGVLMNTRALMELIVINVGMDLGVIPPAVYSMLVLMAIGTTLMATPLATRLLRGSPHERSLVDRGFLRAALLIAVALVAPAAVAADPPPPVTTTLLPDPFANLPPRAVDRHAVVEAGAGGRTPSVLTGVYDVEADPLAVARHGQAAHGRVTANPDGTFTYVPEPGFTGRDAFEFVVADAAGGEASARMLVRVVAPRPSSATVAFCDLEPLVAAGEPARHGDGAVTPRFADLDRDGRIDLLVGAAGGVAWHRSVGSPREPAFAAARPVVAGDGPVAVGGGRVGIAWHDVDGDGLADLVATSDRDLVLRWFRNETPERGPPRFAVARPLQRAGGGEFRAADVRFDVGDLDGDGAADVVTGTFSGAVRLARGGRAADGSLVLADPEPLCAGDGGEIAGSYNLDVRILDFDGDGATDLVDSSNWGAINVRRNEATTGPPALAPAAACTVSGPAWSAVDLHALCDGPIVDFADVDGDGATDLVIGGERGGSLRLARGVGGGECLAFIRDLLATHPDDLGAHLAAEAHAADATRLAASAAALHDTMAHLAGPAERRRLVDDLLAVIAAHPRYLARRSLDPAADRDIASLAGQLWLAVLAADYHDPAVRARLCDAAAFTGPHRALVEECGLLFIDNDRSPLGAEAIRQWLRRIPRDVYPGTGITANDWLGGRRYLTRGHLKNIFSGAPDRGGEYGFGADARPLIGDRGSENQFMTVVHHEASHDLDAFVRRRPERQRRWGRLLVAAGGPDMRADPRTGWLSLELTREHFRAAGLWNGDRGGWDAAWKRYWDTPPGAGWREFGFMRGNIPWFYGSPQESLATQGNQHWNSTEGRLQVAIDRWLRGYRSNLTEVLFFIDLWSAGLDKGLFFETDDASRQVIRYARFGRTEAGHIGRIDLGDRRYEFAIDADGVVTDIRHAPPPPNGSAGPPLDERRFGR